ncbi:MAG TPA: hypothetical protein P5096_01870 [Patescibacteria group bacterium]|nr:hypothetical protein [Patescibacteria group bacterium]
MKKILFAVFLSLLLIPSIAFAADFKTPDETGSVTVGKDDKVRNLYTAGSNVDIRNAVLGDLVTAGGNIDINANIEKGLLAAGGNVTLNNDVGQSARVAGGNVIVNGKVTEDLVAVGGTVKLSKDAGVFGDLVAAGSQVNIDGKVSGNARVIGEKIVINGEIAKDLQIDGVANLTIGDGAVIGGKLIYSSTKEATISPNAKIIGGIDFKKTEKQYKIYGMTTGMAVFSILLKLISLFLTLLLITYFSVKPTKSFVQKALSSPVSALVWGFISLIIIPVIFIALIFSAIGTNIGIICMLIYIALLILASILSSLLIGSLLTKQMNKTKEYPIDWKVCAIGAILTMILGLIPIVGWIIIFAFFLISFGQIIKSLSEKVKREKAK